MPRVYIGQTHDGWVIPTICAVYGALVIFTAFLIAKDISYWRKEALKKLPDFFKDSENPVLRATLTALLILIPALLWPAVLSISSTIIIIVWATTVIEDCRGSTTTPRRNARKAVDLEQGVCHSPDGDHCQDANEQDDHLGGLSTLSPVTTAISEPPPVYTPYPTAHTLHQNQWR